MSFRRVSARPGLELELLRLVIESRWPSPDLESGEGARWSSVRAGHETKDDPVRIRYIHRDSELASVVNVAVRDAQVDTPSGHRHHLFGVLTMKAQTSKPSSTGVLAQYSRWRRPITKPAAWSASTTPRTAEFS